MHSADQKADIGRRYLSTLKARITLRQRKQKESAELAAGFADEHQAKELKPIAIKLLKFHRISGVIDEVEIKKVWDTSARDHIDAIKIELTNGTEILLPSKHIPEIKARLKEKKAAEVLRNELCEEVSFLHGLMSPLKVGEFQAHVGRLWSPASKSNLIPEGEFRTCLEDFITAKRPAVCEVV